MADVVFAACFKIYSTLSGRRFMTALREAEAQGFMINLLNPKTALFYFAFLPQFVDPAKGNVTAQTLFLGAIFVGMAFITDSLYALLASSLAERLRGNRHYQKGQRYFAGLVYVGLGITTALTGSKK